MRSIGFHLCYAYFLYNYISPYFTADSMARLIFSLMETV